MVASDDGEVKNGKAVVEENDAGEALRRVRDCEEGEARVRDCKVGVRDT
jgi:hypothetical protein